MDRFDLDSRNPIFDIPFHETAGGSGILEVTFNCEGEIIDLYEDTRYVPYIYIQLSEKSIEIDMVRPQITNAIGIEDDIHLALHKQIGNGNYTLNFVK